MRLRFLAGLFFSALFLSGSIRGQQEPAGEGRPITPTGTLVRDAGTSLPAVGAIGTVVRNGATKFNTLETPELHQIPVRSAILDRYGKVLAYFYPRGIDRVPVTYSQIAPVMRNAIVAIEDSRFYQHGALDARGTLRALVTDLTGGQVQGGSTLAQQYVKNALLLTAADSAEQRAAVADSAARKIRPTYQLCADTLHWSISLLPRTAPSWISSTRNTRS